MFCRKIFVKEILQNYVLPKKIKFKFKQKYLKQNFHTNKKYQLDSKFVNNAQEISSNLET